MTISPLDKLLQEESTTCKGCVHKQGEYCKLYPKTLATIRCKKYIPIDPFTLKDKAHTNTTGD